MSGIDYEDIFEKADVGIALNDPTEGTIGIVNDRYAELMGYSREALREMAIEEISAKEPMFDQAAAMEKIQQALEGEPQRFDWLFERKDGSEFWGEVALKRTMIGEEDRLVAFVRDISDRKQYERELADQNERLEEFAGIVSHDLRNPLNKASLRLELAREECDSEHLDAVETMHQRMESLIENLLGLAKAGKSNLDTQAVSLQSLVQECWQSVKTETATLKLETATTIQANKPRFRQVVENLLQNAVMHGGEGVTVTVGTLQNGFFVEDDGPGIPAERRDDVFDAGYSSHQEGTGFGLKVVKQIVDAHGWEISVTSGDAGGARFEITDVSR